MGAAGLPAARGNGRKWGGATDDLLAARGMCIGRGIGRGYCPGFFLPFYCKNVNFPNSPLAREMHSHDTCQHVGNASWWLNGYE